MFAKRARDEKLAFDEFGDFGDFGVFDEMATTKFHASLGREDVPAADLGPAVTARCAHARDTLGSHQLLIHRPEIHEMNFFMNVSMNLSGNFVHPLQFIGIQIRSRYINLYNLLAQFRF